MAPAYGGFGARPTIEQMQRMNVNGPNVSCIYAGYLKMSAFRTKLSKQHDVEVGRIVRTQIANWEIEWAFRRPIDGSPEAGELGYFK